MTLANFRYKARSSAVLINVVLIKKDFETTRHFKVRSHEHFYKKQDPSAIFLHLKENGNCYNKRDFQAFSIIDQGSSWFNLQLKEAFHIGWDNPQLNRQVKHMKITLAV